MAKPLTDDERTEIARLLQEGHSFAEITRRTGRSNGTVGRVAAEIGHRSGQTNIDHAHEARSAYSAERRAGIAAQATVRVEEVLARMEGEFLVFNFGGKDNTYEEHTLEAPPVESVRAMAQTVRELVRTVLDIDKHDRRADEGANDVDAWLDTMDVAG